MLLSWLGIRVPCTDRSRICSCVAAQVLTSELFGLRHMASNQSVIHLAPTLGNLALATYLAGGLYQRHGHLNGDPPGTCFGQGCYRRALNLRPLTLYKRHGQRKATRPACASGRAATCEP